MKDRLIIIGGSAGSLDVLLTLLPGLSTSFPVPIVIILHRKASADNSLTQLLASKTRINVQEAEEKEQIKENCIYIAPADYHLLIEKNKTFSLDFSEKVNYSRPSIDVSFQTAAETYGPALTAILLSGANHDGTEGLREVKRFGGTTIVQDPDSAEVNFMPKAAIEADLADNILGPTEMLMYLNQLAIK